MRRSAERSREMPLFDFPLMADQKEPHRADDPADEGADERATAGARANRAAAAEPAVTAGEQIDLLAGTPAARTATGESEDYARDLKLPARRCLAGAIDTAAVLGALAALAAGAAAIGAPPRLAHWPAYLLAALAFSFVWVVFSLSFWGRTPGMRRLGLGARSEGSEGPLTSGQALLRWLGGVVTVALAGLPALLVLYEGRSPADYLSGSDLEGDLEDRPADLTD